MGQGDDDTDYSFHNEDGYERNGVDGLANALTKTKISRGGQRKSSNIEMQRSRRPMMEN